MLSVCFSHSWLNNSPNTTMVGEEESPFLESVYFSIQTSKCSQSKNWCCEAITRQLSEIIRQNLTTVLHAQMYLEVQPFSVQGSLILSCWKTGPNYKRFFFNSVVKVRTQPSRTQFMINLSQTVQTLSQPIISMIIFWTIDWRRTCTHK